jgi:hypothetical protein
MWHYAFDPHTQVPEVELANLKPQQKVRVSTSVDKYLKDVVG